MAGRDGRLAGRGLAAFGYFAFYEYGVTSRNYGLGVLLLFAFCVLYRRRFDTLPWIGLVVFLLCQTTVYGTMCALALLATLLTEYVLALRRGAPPCRPTVALVGFGLIALGVVMAVLQLKTPPDVIFARGWHTEFDLGRLRTVMNVIPPVYYPVPRFTLHFWNTTLFDHPGVPPNLILLVAAITFAWALTFLVQQPLALLFFVSSSAGLLAFRYVKFLGYMRQNGFLFACS